MAQRLRWRKWFFADWIGDTALQKCSPATVGIWSFMLALMDAENYFSITQTIGEFAKSCFTTPAEIRRALDEISGKKVGGVTHKKNDNYVSERYADAPVTLEVTVLSRRFEREYKSRKKIQNRGKIRQRKYRSRKRNAVGNAPITQQKTDNRQQTTDNRPPPISFSLFFPNSELPRFDWKKYADGKPSFDESAEQRVIDAYYERNPDKHDERFLQHAMDEPKNKNAKT